MAPWRKGVLVMCAPEIFYAEDTDGDGKADVRTPLYTGFVEGNQQHRVNTLAWGLDGWVYCANGDSGGRVKSVKTGQVVDIRGRDFRIKPDTGEIEFHLPVGELIDVLRESGLQVERLLELNPNLDPRELQVGQQVRVR